MVELGSHLTASQGWNPGVGWATFPSGHSNKGKSTSKLLQIVSRIHFLVAIEFIAACFFKESNREKTLSATSSL